MLARFSSGSSRNWRRQFLNKSTPAQGYQAVCCSVFVTAVAVPSGDERGPQCPGDPGRGGADPVQVRPRCRLFCQTRLLSCHSLCCVSLCFRAEFLSLLRTYNCFLKEQTQLHLTYSQVGHKPNCFCSQSVSQNASHFSTAAGLAVHHMTYCRKCI